jgi:hypothetical protein
VAPRANHVRDHVHGRRHDRLFFIIYKAKSNGVHERQLATPIPKLVECGTLTVAVSDRQGNVARIGCTMSVNVVK